MKNNFFNKVIVLTILFLFLWISSVQSINNDIEKAYNDEETITLNNDTYTLYPSKDTHIRHIYPNTNYGSSEELVTRNEYGGGGSPGYGVDTLIEFDLSEIPSGATIVNANLYLYFSRWTENFPGGRLLTMHQITENWDEFTVTWNTKPSYNGDISASANVPSSTQMWMELDVTSDVQNFVDGTETNYGWTIMDENYWGSVDIPAAYFPSNEGSDNFPYLEVETENGGNGFKTTFLIGKLDNLNTDGDTITFEAVNIRCIQFAPFGFIPYTSGEQITISKDYMGLLTPRFIFALCGVSI